MTNSVFLLFSQKIIVISTTTTKTKSETSDSLFFNYFYMQLCSKEFCDVNKVVNYNNGTRILSTQSTKVGDRAYDRLNGFVRVTVGDKYCTNISRLKAGLIKHFQLSKQESLRH